MELCSVIIDLLWPGLNVGTQEFGEIVHKQRCNWKEGRISLNLRLTSGSGLLLCDLRSHHKR